MKNNLSNQNPKQKKRCSYQAVVLLLLLFLAGPACFSQQSAIQSAVDSACTCLYDVCIKKKDKLTFDEASESCLSTYLDKMKKAGTPSETREQLSDMIHVTLKNGCDKFAFIDSVRTSFLYQENTDFIVEIDDCELMKNGRFVGVGDDSGTYILMRDSIQTVHFSDGTYTKSKVDWSPLCTYSLTRIESTNAYESAAYSPGDVREFSIVGVEDQKTFQYQTVINDRVYMGRLTKVSE